MKYTSSLKSSRNPFDPPWQPRSAGFSVVETTGGREVGSKPRAQGLAWGLMSLEAHDVDAHYAKPQQASNKF